MKNYFIKNEYVSRLDNKYFNDTRNTDKWQKEVYIYAKKLFNENKFFGTGPRTFRLESQKVEYNKDGDALLDNKQVEYAIEEVRRCKEGFWFLNNGIETYITGKNYFYIQWWKLENDEYPEFRNTDREYFLFLNHWENVPC
jgi:hypothetical protein